MPGGLLPPRASLQAAIEISRMVLIMYAFAALL